MKINIMEKNYLKYTLAQFISSKPMTLIIQIFSPWLPRAQGHLIVVKWMNNISNYKLFNSIRPLWKLKYEYGPVILFNLVSKADLYFNNPMYYLALRSNESWVKWTWQSQWPLQPLIQSPPHTIRYFKASQLLVYCYQYFKKSSLCFNTNLMCWKCTVPQKQKSNVYLKNINQKIEFLNNFPSIKRNNYSLNLENIKLWENLL